MEDENKLEYALRGKDWKVYWLLLKSGRSMSVREVQKSLHFSSPSVAQHHLEQLRELGLMQKQDIGGHYSLTSEVKIGVLRHFVKLGKLLFPIFLLRGFLHNLLHGLSFISNARLHARKPVYPFVRSDNLSNILVRGNSCMVFKTVLISRLNCTRA
jgi:predicted DNA-binding transcriptional regulator